MTANPERAIETVRGKLQADEYDVDEAGADEGLALDSVASEPRRLALARI
jgi:hypothetical protein